MDSRVVAHPSTNTAWRSLTSLFGWEAVLSAQYGRIHQHSVSSPWLSRGSPLLAKHLSGIVQLQSPVNVMWPTGSARLSCW